MDLRDHIWACDSRESTGGYVSMMQELKKRGLQISNFFQTINVTGNGEVRPSLIQTSCQGDLFRRKQHG